MNLRGPWLALALMLASSASSGCFEDERTTSNLYPDPLCLEFPWISLSNGQTGCTPPDLICETTLDCPPPLTCRLGADDNFGSCALLDSVPDPSAPAQAYEKPEFLLSVTEGDDYNLIEFNGLPPSATVLRCSFYICPPDAAVLVGAPGRCFHTSKIVNLGLTNGLALSVVVNGPESLAAEGRINVCGPVVGDEQLPDRSFGITAVGYYAICYAFDETDLVAVSAISNLSRNEIGNSAQDTYVSDCTSPSAEDGYACSYTDGTDDDELGICVGGACCPACWNDRDCRRNDGDTCVQVRDLRPRRRGGQAMPPVTGYCSDAPCRNRMGDRVCVSRRATVDAAVACESLDAGVGPARDAQAVQVIEDEVTDAGRDAFVSAWTRTPAVNGACDDLDAGQMGPDGGGGMPPDGEGRDGGGPGEMGPPPDMGMAPDASPAPDMGPALDGGPAPDRGPPPDMGPPPDGGIMPPRMP